MALTHSTAARNALADQIDTLVNTGSGSAKLRIKTSADAVLVEFTLQNPAFGAAANGQITLQGTPISATAGATGTAAKFDVLDRNGSMVFEGTVATSGGDLTITNTSITSGQTVNLNSLTYTAPD